MKPGNAGGAKGPQFKDNAANDAAARIGDEPTNTRKGPEVADGVACQSEGRTQVPLLRLVRQGVSEGRLVDGLAALPGKRRGAGSRRRSFRGHRGVGRGGGGGGTGGRKQAED